MSAARVASAWAPALAYAGLIFAVSSIQARAMPSGALWNFDKLIHAAEYAVLAALVFRALLRVPAWSEGRAAIAAWFVASLYGVSDELHQSLVPGRDASLFDVVADAAGAAAAVLVLFLVVRRRSALS